MSKATLYICATPIGNLQDISPRLTTSLSAVDLIACEDTRVTLNLLAYLKIKKPLTSLEKFSEAKKTSVIIAALQSGKSVALVSDAGTPLISDPGEILINKVVEAGFTVVPISGPSAVSTFLSAAGFKADRFYFAGFFPKKTAEKEQVMAALCNVDAPLIFFESGKRILATLNWLEAHTSIEKVVVARELTKAFETWYRGDIQGLIKDIESGVMKGEWIFGVQLKNTMVLDLKKTVEGLQSIGLDNKQIMKVATDYLGVKRNELYTHLHA